jgi:DNA-directed RNA polymerase subunit RPC12/RpoP
MTGAPHRDRENDRDLAVERRSPTAVFSLLGDETRVGILEALGETPNDAVPFAVLRERVGVPDSGQFNYHLGRLRGPFVRRTDEGYRLTYAGRQVVGAMHAGTYTASATIDRIPVEGDCLLCGGDVVAAYADETAVVECADCGEWRNELPFPPGSLDQFERADLPLAFDRWMRHVFRGIVDGFCVTCAGRTEGRLAIDDGDAGDGDDTGDSDEVGAGDRNGDRDGDGEGSDSSPSTYVEYTCGRCGTAARASTPLPALFHPAVQGFFYERGIDLDRRPTWQLREVLVPDVTLDGRDPLRATVRFAGEAESLAVVVEADARVGGVERRPTAPDADTPQR